jgi:hypothetical protein
MEGTTTTTAATPAPTQALAPREKAPIAMGPAGVQLPTFEALWRWSQVVAASGWAPKGMEKPEAIAVAIQAGAEMGLTPMQSLQSMAVINGRPGLYGDAALGLVRASGLLEVYTQRIDGTGDDRAATVTVKRRDSEPIVSRFSIADAKRAGLWGKPGPWTQYPDRMQMWRARGYALRDAFGDVLKGMKTAEELHDRDVIDVTPSAPAEATAAGDRTAEVAARLGVAPGQEPAPAPVPSPAPAEQAPAPAGGPSGSAKEAGRRISALMLHTALQRAGVTLHDATEYLRHMAIIRPTADWSSVSQPERGQIVDHPEAFGKVVTEWLFTKLQPPAPAQEPAPAAEPAPAVNPPAATADGNPTP